MSGIPELAAYFAIVVALIGALMVVTHPSRRRRRFLRISERHSQRATGVPYDSGMAPTGTARVRFSADFYLVAMFFVVFDIESVFIFAWAVAARELSWAGYAEILVFVGVLIAALGYLWRRGAFEFRRRRGSEIGRSRERAALR